MHVMVIHHWPEDNPTLAQTVAETLGVLVFEARQRMAGGGPVVIGNFADPLQAESLRNRLEQKGVPTILIDTEALRNGAKLFRVRQFSLDDAVLHLTPAAGEVQNIPYAEIALVLPATTVVSQSESTTTVTERKFSFGKTIMAGGIPMTKKVKQEISTQSEERDEVLCLYTTERPPVVFRRGALNYAGLGTAMQMSRELNFAYLKSELRRRASHAVFDDRLLKRANQVRLLGTALDPDTHLDLTFEILARSYAGGEKNG